MKKKDTRECFCILCRSPRKLRYSRHLRFMNYIQMVVMTIGITAATYPWFDWKGALTLPFVWAIFEGLHKSLYRKDLKCPHCGFDPKWYKKDVRLARQKVEEFLRLNPEAPIHRRTRSREETTTSN